MQRVADTLVSIDSRTFTFQGTVNMLLNVCMAKLNMQTQCMLLFLMHLTLVVHLFHVRQHILSIVDITA